MEMQSKMLKQGRASTAPCQRCCVASGAGWEGIPGGYDVRIRSRPKSKVARRYNGRETRPGGGPRRRGDSGGLGGRYTSRTTVSLGNCGEAEVVEVAEVSGAEDGGWEGAGSRALRKRQGCTSSAPNKGNYSSACRALLGETKVQGLQWAASLHSAGRQRAQRARQEQLTGGLLPSQCHAAALFVRLQQLYTVHM